jgi:hypothetical protein
MDLYTSTTNSVWTLGAKFCFGGEPDTQGNPGFNLVIGGLCVYVLQGFSAYSLFQGSQS